MSVNWWAVIVAALVQMAVGFIWFSPALFFKAWLDANGIQTTPKPRPAVFLMMLVLTLISSYGLVLIFANLGIRSAAAGLAAAFFIWLATLMPFTVGTTMATGRKQSLIWMEFGHTLIGILLAGLILGAWH